MHRAKNSSGTATLDWQPKVLDYLSAAPAKGPIEALRTAFEELPELDPKGNGGTWMPVQPLRNRKSKMFLFSNKNLVCNADVPKVPVAETTNPIA